MTENLAPIADVSPLGSFSHCHADIISHLNTFGELSALLEPAARARRIAHETLGFFRRDPRCDDSRGAAGLLPRRRI